MTVNSKNHNLGFCFFHFPFYYIAEIVKAIPSSSRQKEKVYRYVNPIYGPSRNTIVYKLVAIVPDHELNLSCGSATPTQSLDHRISSGRKVKELRINMTNWRILTWCCITQEMFVHVQQYVEVGKETLEQRLNLQVDVQERTCLAHVRG